MKSALKTPATNLMPDTEEFEVVELFGKKVLIAGHRIRHAQREDLLSKYPIYFYCFRGSDYDPGIPVTIEHKVIVNFAGTVISKTNLLDENEEYKYIQDIDLNFLSESASIQEYLDEKF